MAIYPNGKEAHRGYPLQHRRKQVKVCAAAERCWVWKVLHEILESHESQSFEWTQSASKIGIWMVCCYFSSKKKSQLVFISGPWTFSKDTGCFQVAADSEVPQQTWIFCLKKSQKNPFECQRDAEGKHIPRDPTDLQKPRNESQYPVSRVSSWPTISLGNTSTINSFSNPKTFLLLPWLREIAVQKNEKPKNSASTHGIVGSLVWY